MKPALLCLCAVLLAAGETLPDLALVSAFGATRFDRPLWVAQVPGADRFLVLEQPGVAKLVERGGTVTTVLDLSDTVKLPGGYTEEGLLSAEFHPRFAQNRQLFLWFTTKRSGKLQTVLARFRIAADGSRIEPREEPLLTIDQPYGNHNGGDLHFGSDGFLYLSIGDGGSGGDPQNHAQRLDSLLGKIVRLDVDRKDGGNPYSVPRDNPFVGTKGARGEIWAYGLRNVWRMSFDPPTGELWAGDVGQNAFEEITLISKGGNHGWKLREGFSAFDKGALAPEMMQPVWDYPRSEGQSVTGGFVYRGKAIPDLVGAYVFGDFASRRVWALRRGQGKPAVREVARAPGPLASFGTDAAGELYACCLDGGIYRLALR